MTEVITHIKNGVISKLTTNGNSMFPTILNNETVEISPISSTLSPGKLYLFNYRSNIIIHRLLKFDETNCIFIGDNTSTIHKVSIKDVIGKAEKIENWVYNIVVRTLNKILVTKSYEAIRLNFLRIKLIRLAFLITHRGKYERKI